MFVQQALYNKRHLQINKYNKYLQTKILQIVWI